MPKSKIIARLMTALLCRVFVSQPSAASDEAVASKQTDYQGGVFMKRMICLILLALGLQNTHVLALTPDEVDARMRAMVQGNIDNPWPGISDPDGDGVLNAIEAFFGSHPGEVSSGLIALNVTSEEISFTHPQSDQPPADLQLSYSWSCNLADWYDCDGANGPASGETVSVSSETVDGTATVTVTPSAEMGCLFLRAKVQEK